MATLLVSQNGKPAAFRKGENNFCVTAKRGRLSFN
jgi:hypothetical protein